MKKLARPEQPVQIAIANYLRQRRFLFTAPDSGINVSSPKMRQIYHNMGRRAGISDLVVWIPGGTVCIEVKRPKTLKYSEKSGKMIVADAGGKQSEEQKEFEELIHKLKGHYYLVATSVTEVDRFFKENKILPF